MTKEYSNGEISIVWKPHMCTHSCICWKNLPTVFNPREKPWIKEKAEDSKIIMEQIDKCPSKALSYFKNENT